jgi:hypothetical protein
VDARVTDFRTGLFVSGTAYLAQLYYGPAGTTDWFTMVPVLDAPGGSIAAPAWFSSGTLPGYILTSTGGGNRYTDPAIVVPGALTSFQLRAWSAVLGGSWEEALVNYSSTTSLGFSAIIEVATSANNLDTPKPLTGLQPFTIGVPEPSVIALGVLGLLALLWHRSNDVRKKFP